MGPPGEGAKVADSSVPVIFCGRSQLGDRVGEAAIVVATGFEGVRQQRYRGRAIFPFRPFCHSMPRTSGTTVKFCRRAADIRWWETIPVEPSTRGAHESYSIPCQRSGRDDLDRQRGGAADCTGSKRDGTTSDTGGGRIQFDRHAHGTAGFAFVSCRDGT